MSTQHALHDTMIIWLICMAASYHSQYWCTLHQTADRNTASNLDIAVA